MLVTIKNQIYNTALIKHIREANSNHEPPACTIITSDGHIRTVSVDIDEFEALCGTIVPAQPGHILIQAILPDPRDDRSGIEYVSECVIAFRIIGAGTAPVPIAPSGEPSTSTNVLWVVKQPNGTCTGMGRRYNDLAAFRASCVHASGERAVRPMLKALAG